MHYPADLANWQDVYFTSQDGLRLHGRHYRMQGGSKQTPALCLPGLTRNARDFHQLASFLSDPRNPSGRDVLVADYRGRGLSQWDPSPRNYALQVEMQDALDFVTVLNVPEIAIVGTSRGGLIAMMMACLRPTAIRMAVLNDIGPVIERDGLVRIAATVGKVPVPASWTEATSLVRQLHGRPFSGVPEEHWEAIARQLFNDEQGSPSPGYDPALSQTLAVTDGPLPELWPQFAALARVPVLAIRGEHSDLFSERTLQRMQQDHPTVETLIVRGQGHAPLLIERATMLTINEFLTKSEARASATALLSHATPKN